MPKFALHILLQNRLQIVFIIQATLHSYVHTHNMDYWNSILLHYVISTNIYFSIMQNQKNQSN